MDVGGQLTLSDRPLCKLTCNRRGETIRSGRMVDRYIMETTAGFQSSPVLLQLVRQQRVVRFIFKRTFVAPQNCAGKLEDTLIVDIMLRQFLSRPLLSGPISLIGRSEQFSVQKVLKLNDLRHAEGAVKKVSGSRSHCPPKRSYILNVTYLTEEEVG